MDWSIGSIHPSKLFFAASTVWPSEPEAELRRLDVTSLEGEACLALPKTSTN